MKHWRNLGFSLHKNTHNFVYPFKRLLEPWDISIDPKIRNTGLENEIFRGEIMNICLQFPQELLGKGIKISKCMDLNECYGSLWRLYNEGFLHFLVFPNFPTRNIYGLF